MAKFSFRFSPLGLLYSRIASLINKRILSKNTLDMEGIDDIFDALDGFWSKHKDTDSYSIKQIRVIIGSITESLRDNSLSADEVKLVTDHVMAYWNPQIAEAKPAEKAQIPEEIEAKALKAVEVHDHILPKNIEEFVSASSTMISKPISPELISQALSRLFR